MQHQATIYQINTATFLNELSQQEGKQITLATVPDSAWDELVRPSITTIWFMGIWQRSQRSRELNYGAQWLKDALPDMTDADVIGSAYSVQAYTVDESFGGDEGFAVARRKLNERGISLMLDFVPNHTAIDHSWVTEHPEFYLSGTAEELEQSPDSFVQTESGIFANAKDPQFPAWSDVLQLNAYSPAMRQAAIDTLLKISEQCDAVRCDMTMLMMNDVFRQTWGKRAGPAPAEEYWEVVIHAVKSLRPNFLFVAEAYWGKEPELIEQGFDACYDKDTYDYLIEGNVRELKKHLEHVMPIQDRLLRFVENHDEPRIGLLPIEQHKAAAVISMTLPGIRLLHDGEFEGRLVRVPVQLARRKDEPVNEAVHIFYSELLTEMETMKVGQGSWHIEPVRSTLFGNGAHHVLAWSWQNEAGKTMITVNYSDKQVRVKLGKQLVQLEPWQYMIERS